MGASHPACCIKSKISYIPYLFAPFFYLILTLDWTHDDKIRNEQDRRAPFAPVLFVFMMELPRYSLNIPIIRSASVEVTVSLGPRRPSAGTRPF